MLLQCLLLLTTMIFRTSWDGGRSESKTVGSPPIFDSSHLIAVLNVSSKGEFGIVNNALLS